MPYASLVAPVVDDSATMRRIVRNILRDLQFKEVLEAENGAEAFNKSRKVVELPSS